MISAILFIISGILAISSAWSLYPRHSQYLNYAAVLLAFLSIISLFIWHVNFNPSIFICFWLGIFFFIIALGIVIFRNK